MECQYCHKVLSSKLALNRHQQSTKSCLVIQEKEPTNYKCICGATFSLKQCLIRHKLNCRGEINNNKLKTATEELRNQLRTSHEELEEAQNQNKHLESQLQLLKDQNFTLMETNRQNCKILAHWGPWESTSEKTFNKEDENDLETPSRELISSETEPDDGYRQLQEENKKQKVCIEKLTKKYVKLQPRVQIATKNVIYILTTKLLKAEQRYILGKATNLTNRLSSYNKTDEHEIIYYQQCSDTETMSLVEKIIFHKLKPYREQANRERFILPGSKDISLFSDTINQSINQLEEFQPTSNEQTELGTSGTELGTSGTELGTSGTELNLGKELLKSQVENSDFKKQLKKSQVENNNLTKQLEKFQNRITEQFENLAPTTQETIDDYANKITLKNGDSINTYVDFWWGYLENKIICYNRTSCKYKNNKGNIVEDPGMQTIQYLIHNASYKPYHDCFLLWYTTERDPHILRVMGPQYKNSCKGIEDGINGKNTNFTRSFIKLICIKMELVNNLDKTFSEPEGGQSSTSEMELEK